MTISSQDLNTGEAETEPNNFINDNGSLKYEMFSDIVKIGNDQIPNSPFFIDFTSNYDHNLEILRGMITTQEKSIRGLALTEVIIMENPSDVIAWWYRTEILKTIEFDTIKELRFIDKVMEQGLKSYQAWQHRQWTITKMASPPDDLSYLFDRINEDPRNFHAWSYSIWLADFCKLQKTILDMTTFFIRREKKNASAWNARYTILTQMNDDFSQEIQFVFNFIGNDGGNESCCNYVRGIVKSRPELLQNCLEKVEEFIQKNTKDRSVYALYLHLLELSGNKEKRTEICKKLCVLDSLRKNYWTSVMNGDDRFI
ncbi:prenyltransferase alpha subunit [Tritrichomonas foetus]|uniref:Protein farnesyltransferase/geranylgeranyltransferase type-1 subunit alpha n=1 Tax=Tritrichomonas foetus TaxID=1144522 RepID=A0A1J4K744_9EUKA|nr:prenyltransferase alpha subunit [Tritrichomonas foetus]|eukprot:OHT07011.1 prenyltransferase alpha subunit [Tritrichomonas foetus]